MADQSPALAPLHHRERERLLELASVALFETPPEERFDRVARLASRWLEAPMALFSLVGADSLSFKATHGLDACRGPRDGSFCSHAIVSEEPRFEVRDARTDPRFEAHPLVLSDPHLRFYAAVPVVSASGLPLGVLCVLDSAPRALCPEQWEALSDLAAILSEDLQRIAATRGQQERLREALDRDPLTGLPSAGRFFTEVQQALAARPEQVALAMVDLDDFSALNRTLGHAAGDRVLESAAALLRERLSEHALLARGEGDRFLVLLEGSGACPVGPEIQAALSELVVELSVDGAAVRVTASAGIASSQGDHPEAFELYERASAALSRARSSGERGSVCFHDTPADARLQEDYLLLCDLQEALSTEQIHMAYQPKIDLGSGRITGFEALIRWNHPEHGAVSPGRFIPLAERSSFMELLSERVLRETCETLARWHAAGVAVPISINLPAEAAVDARLPARIAELLRAHGLPGRLLEIELTERSLSSDLSKTGAVLQRLQDLGVSISIDDFGVGYSCLGYLAQLPVDCLKIDRSFIARLGEPGGAAVALAVLRLAQTLGLGCVAEGVEEPGQADTLREWGCRSAQGWLYSAAVPAHEALGLLEEGRVWIAAA